MKQILRVSIVVLVLALIAVGVAAAFWSWWRNAPAVAVSPDGSRLKFIGSAFGSQTFTTERPWHKLARQTLPYRWQNWIPATLTVGAYGGSNRVTFCFRASPPNGVSLGLLCRGRCRVSLPDGKQRLEQHHSRERRFNRGRDAAGLSAP